MTDAREDTETYHNPKERPARMILHFSWAFAAVMILGVCYVSYLVLAPQVGSLLAIGFVASALMMAAFIEYIGGPDADE